MLTRDKNLKEAMNRYKQVSVAAHDLTPLQRQQLQVKVLLEQSKEQEATEGTSSSESERWIVIARAERETSSMRKVTNRQQPTGQDHD